MSRARRLVASLALAAAALPTSADDDRWAGQWLERSAEAAARADGEGWKRGYHRVRIDLARARVHARRGEIQETLGLLPTLAHGARPGWASGGGGAVLALLAGEEIIEAREVLFLALASAGRVDDAAVVALNADAYETLGYGLGRAGEPIPESLAGERTPAQRAELLAGELRGLVAGGHEAAAARAIERLPAALRAKLLERVAFALHAAGDRAAPARLLRLTRGGEAGVRTQARAVDALLYAGDIGAAAEAALEIPEPRARDRLLGRAAAAAAGRADLATAARLFAAASSHVGESWEQVAHALGREDWLVERYRSIADPWRRSERLLQLARRLAGEGRSARALEIASLAEAAAGSIPSASTRRLAARLLAEVLAESGAPLRAGRVAAGIPAESGPSGSQRDTALAAAAAGWARADDAEAALATAQAVGDLAARAGALARAAGILRPSAPAEYEVLVAAVRDLGTAPSDAARDAIWATLVTEQRAAGDVDGAQASAGLAASAGAGAAAYEALVDAHLAAGDLAAAAAAAPRVPAGVDPRSGSDRRTTSITKVVEAHAARGDGIGALEAAAGLPEGPARELAAPMVAAALAAQGEEARAAELARSLRRDDARDHALAAVIEAILARGGRPDPARIMAALGEGPGSALCWAVGARVARTASRAEADGWLAALAAPGCAAFAYAGAAFGLVEDAEATTLERLLLRVDPRRVQERMAAAMLRQVPMR